MALSDASADPALGGPSAAAIDRVFLAYLTASGLVALAAGGAVGIALAAARLGVGAAVIGLARRPPPRGGAGLVLRLAYPVLLTPLLYAELSILVGFVAEGTYDPLVLGWEEAVFGGQVAMEMARRIPSFWLSEVLHAGYVSYYALVPCALLGVWATRGPDALHRTATATAVAFFASYVVFILFPVEGPRYGFPPIGGEIAEGALHDLVHAILEGGSSRGTAFPSSHVAASGAAVLAAGREDRRWLWLLLLPWIALTVGTVYGRFHYGVDALAGVAVGLAAVAAGAALTDRWPAPLADRWAARATPFAGRASKS